MDPSMDHPCNSHQIMAPYTVLHGSLYSAVKVCPNASGDGLEIHRVVLVWVLISSVAFNSSLSFAVLLSLRTSMAASSSSASQPVASTRAHGASQPGGQRRLAKDGLAYTYQEFMEYYGDRGDERWQAARAPQLQQGTHSETRYELNLEGVKMYSSLMEAMIDSKYRGLCGEDLVNAYAADILQTEQRLQSQHFAYFLDTDLNKGRRLLCERLQLLRQKTAELTRSRKSHDTTSWALRPMDTCHKTCELSGENKTWNFWSMPGHSIPGSAGLQGWANMKRSQEAATLTDPSGVAQPAAEAADPAAQDLTSAPTVPAVTAAPVAAEPP